MNTRTNIVKNSRRSFVAAIVIASALSILGASVWPRGFGQVEARAEVSNGDTAYAICCQRGNDCSTHSGTECPGGSAPVGCPCQIP